MGVLSMRATAIVSALKWGIFVAGVLAKHTAMPITTKIEKTHPENAPLRMMANCSLRNAHATIPHATAMPHTTHSARVDGAMYCHAIPIIRGINSLRNGT